MFALQVTFLNGVVAAKRADDEQIVEWPPHPLRLFAALAAAYFEGGEDAAEGKALEWLEAQEPPLIWAPGPVGSSRSVPAFVPVNDVKGRAVIPEVRGQEGGRKPRRFVSAALSDPEVVFGWSAEPDAEVRQALAQLAARVACLGHSSSLVRVLVSGAPNGEPTWRPAQRGTELFRTPFPGLLQALRFAHDRYLKAGIRGPLPAVSYPYVALAPRMESAPLPLGGHFDTLWSLRRVQGPVLPILAAAGVATALHRAVLGRWAELTAQGVLPPIPEEVSGHDADGVPLQRPHVAFLALPAVGSRWSDGHLLGLGLALPRALAAEVRAGLWRVLSGLQTLTLRPEPWSLESAGLGGASDLPVLLKPSSWCRPAQVWGSVTPVVLDRFPSDLFGEEAKESVRVACQRAGLPEPASVVLRPTSLVLGVPPAREFPAYPSDRPTPRVHAVLIFPERVAGPVLVGRGRYRGLGLFYPLEG